MPWNTVFNIIGAVGGLFGIVGGLCGIASLVYARRQTKLMEDDKHKREREEKVYGNYPNDVRDC